MSQAVSVIMLHGMPSIWSSQNIPNFSCRVEAWYLSSLFWGGVCMYGCVCDRERDRFLSSVYVRERQGGWEAGRDGHRERAFVFLTSSSHRLKYYALPRPWSVLGRCARREARDSQKWRHS